MSSIRYIYTWVKEEGSFRGAERNVVSGKREGCHFGEGRGVSFWGESVILGRGEVCHFGGKDVISGEGERGVSYQEGEKDVNIGLD